MHVTKEGLLKQKAVYQELVKNGEPHIDDYLKLIDMIYRYVYFKTPWYADLPNVFYVDISDSLMDQLQDRPNFDIKLLYLQLLLLSNG